MTPHEWIREQLQRWRQELINLSRTNRLLHFRRTRSTLDVLEPPPAELLRGLTGTASFSIHEPPDPKTDVADLAPRIPSETTAAETPRRAIRAREILTSAADRTRLLSALTNLERRANQEFLDKGLWVLYLAVGMLEWVDFHGDEPARVQSPLLLIPIALDHPNPQRPFQLRRASDEDPTINPALAAKLDHDFGISLPGLDEIDELDPDTLFEIVRDRARDHPDWNVTPQVVLGTFSFHKEVMYRDLLANEERIVDHPLVCALALKPGESEIDLGFDPISEDRLDEEAPPEKMLTILDADASQRQCIAAARDGRSFVMDGPPGTGKSQTIANLIAELLGRGQTVLFVSEKAAALEVVHGRLEEAGIADFVLPLHSHKTTRREVAVELGRSLTWRPRPSPPLDAARLECLAARRHQLSSYALAINETRAPLGQSLHQVLGRIAQLQPLPQAPLPDSLGLDLDATTLLRLLDAAGALARAWAPVERGPGFLWRDLVNAGLDASRRRTLLLSLGDAATALAALEESVSALTTEIGIPWNHSPADADRFIGLLRHLATRRPVPANWLTAPNLEPMERRAKELAGLTGEARRLANTLTAKAGSRWAQLGGDRDSSVIADSITAFSHLIPELSVDPEWVASELRTRADFLKRSAEHVRVAAEKSGRIASAFGLRESDSSLHRMSELAEMGQLAGSPTPPAPAWLGRSSLTAAEQSARVLGEQVADCLSHRRGLTGMFTDGVLALDLEGLCVRFETVHRSWRKLLPGHWRDRRTLAACTRSRRVTRDELGRLRDALAWQQARESLTAAEERHAASLDSYYAGERTDFSVLTSALHTARRALELAGPEVDQTKLQHQLTARDQVDPGLVPLARELDTSVERWLREATSYVGELGAAELAKRPLAAATLCFEKGYSLLLTASEVLERTAIVTGKNLPLGEVREITAMQADFLRLKVRIEADSERDSALLLPDLMPLVTDWNDLLASLRWLRELREILGDGILRPIDDALGRRLAETIASPAPLVITLERWRGLIIALGAEFEDDHRRTILAEIELSFEAGRSLLTRLSETIDDITCWEAFLQARSALASTGLASAVQFAMDQRLPAASVAAVLECAILERWAAEVIRSDDRLKHTRPEDREHLIEEFQALDRAFIQASSGRVIDLCNAKRPTTLAGVAGILHFEAQKQRKHMPVARLLAATQAVVQAIKPCFMMSPLTVSQFLPAAMRFDVVIFDEASQVCPSDAINCIYRGDRLVVAGDPKQLPPTTFFETVGLDGDDEWHEDEISDFESVLDLCQAHGFPSLTLRWHYRSQHEDLITFSNYSFYDGRLLTFPGAQQAGPDLGVELFKVPGVYRRGGARDNPVEARKVVERVHFHTIHHPDLSLGVVTFSEAQATVVRDALEAQCVGHPELRSLLDTRDRLRGFFVKNLETVQGDERDILIFSVGYGPDENGKFTKQLGPLSRKGGERRLNVAVTRARRRVEVVSSIGADDFGGELVSDGSRHLRRYLDYAERPQEKVRALALDVATTGRDLESPFEEAIARLIRSWGYDVVPQLGCAGYRIDLALRHPERPAVFALGVECDGAAYHSSRVARDRDRLRQEILKGLGWRLYRIWGPSWYRNRGEQERRLRHAIEAAVAAPPSFTRPSSPNPPEPTRELDHVPLEAAPAWTVPYQAATPPRPRLGVQMHEDGALPDLCRMIDVVVGFEAPAHAELVLRRLREAWGVQRAGARIRATYEAALRRLSRGGRLHQDEAGFLSCRGSLCDKVRVPTDDPRSQRGISEVPPTELQLAVTLLVTEACSISPDEVTATVARLFGWQRRGPDITKALDLAIDSCLAAGSIVRDGLMLRRRDTGDQHRVPPR